MHEFCISEFIDEAIAADGNRDILLAAVEVFNVKIQETIDEPFANAKSWGLPTGWSGKKYAASTTRGGSIFIWNQDGLKFNSKNKAFAFIGLKKRDPSLTDEMCNAIYHKLPPGWKAHKAVPTSICRSDTWVCVDPEGKRFSSLKAAKDSSQSTMAASADMRARDVLRLKEILSDIEDPTIRSSGLELLENIIASDDSKPAAKPSTSKPAAISSAVAVTAKKGKGKKRCYQTATTSLMTTEIVLSC